VRRLCVSFAVAVAALAVVSCRGSGGVPKEQADRMQKLADLVGVAFSKEDWHGAYKLYPPSIRKSCSEDDYIKSVTAAADFARQAVGDQAWEDLKKDAADGYDLTSIQADGDQATARAKEGDEPLLFRREDGDWWYYEADPCGYKPPGTPVGEASPTPAATGAVR